MIDCLCTTAQCNNVHSHSFRIFPRPTFISMFISIFNLYTDGDPVTERAENRPCRAAPSASGGQRGSRRPGLRRPRLGSGALPRRVHLSHGPSGAPETNPGQGSRALLIQHTANLSGLVLGYRSSGRQLELRIDALKNADVSSEKDVLRVQALMRRRRAKRTSSFCGEAGRET